MNHQSKYDPAIHHRRSIRLQGYDYSRAGMYFITLCCDNRRCLFGRVENGQMLLNEAGRVADACWLEIPTHFPNAVLHAHVIMPNHVHGIVELSSRPNGAVGPVGAENFLPLRAQPQRNEFQKMIPKSIGSIVKGYKIGVTKWFRNRDSDSVNDSSVKVWQRSYYEHIIRDERAYQAISTYIRNNPLKWGRDKFHP